MPIKIGEVRWRCVLTLTLLAAFDFLPGVTAMKRIALPSLLAAFILCTSFVASAEAQYKAKSHPFDTSSRRPSVSPYMNLINNQTGTATNYQSLVRPQLDQQNYNARTASAIKGLQGSRASSAKSGDKSKSQSSSEGNLKLRPTGHTAMREGYSHYFPGLSK